MTRAAGKTPITLCPLDQYQFQVPTKSQTPQFPLENLQKRFDRPHIANLSLQTSKLTSHLKSVRMKITMDHEPYRTKTCIL